MAIVNPVFIRHQAGAYDGTNSAEIMMLLNSADPPNPLWLFDSADSEQMIFTDLYGTPFILELDQWVVVSPLTGFINRYTTEAYQNTFVEMAEITP